MSEQLYRERECIHRARHSVAGEYYRGQTYLKHLQRLRTDAAMKVAGNVTAFFWADAAHVIVWLCDDCAHDLGVGEREASVGPHAFSLG